jgi:hypothetical protein
MTISLAFLAPDLVIDGRLPHGMGVARLADMSAAGRAAFVTSSTIWIWVSMKRASAMARRDVAARRPPRNDQATWRLGFLFRIGSVPGATGSFFG